MPNEQVAEDATDEQIFKTLQQMRSDRENMEINGGDDSNGGSPQVPKEALQGLQVVATLRR